MLKKQPWNLKRSSAFFALVLRCRTSDWVSGSFLSSLTYPQNFPTSNRPVFAPASKSSVYFSQQWDICCFKATLSGAILSNWFRFGQSCTVFSEWHATRPYSRSSLSLHPKSFPYQNWIAAFLTLLKYQFAFLLDAAATSFSPKISFFGDLNTTPRLCGESDCRTCSFVAASSD